MHIQSHHHDDFFYCYNYFPAPSLSIHLACLFQNPTTKQQWLPLSLRLLCWVVEVSFILHLSLSTQFIIFLFLFFLAFIDILWLWFLKWLQFQEQCVHQLLLEMVFLLHSLSLLEALVDACPKEGFFSYFLFNGILIIYSYICLV